MTPTFEAQLAAAWPPDRWQDVTVLVAVSGGPDSTALLCALAALKPPGPGRLIAAHFNHRLRGEQADGDERFVVELSGALGVACRVGRPAVADGLDTGAGADRADACRSSEETSRAARYDFLTRTAKELGARYVVTAHTADDQAETVLHRILRGTGVAGMAGMAEARELAPGIALVRPLLGINRATVLDYLTEMGQSFCHDSSNASLDYTRNRLRNDLLPKLAAEYNPRVVESLLRLAQLAREAQRIIEVDAAALATRAIVSAGHAQIVIDTAPLAEATPYLVREMLMAIWREQNWPLQAMGFDEWDALAALAIEPLEAQRKRDFPGSITAERKGEKLVLNKC
ncbi:MAG TPA: tRNA lysidine(34) synthetase TilS [Pirellulales bacterium]|nr:tRNA lysidine(34) synthetase TilS [Pirellulales bacterium]